MTNTLAWTERPSVEPPSGAALPAAGPAWFGSLMGTAILATLSQTVAPIALAGPAEIASRALLAFGWTLLIALSAAAVLRARRERGVFTGWVSPAQVPFWGMVSMGLLALGSSTSTIVPQWIPSLTGLAWQLDLLLWWLGTVLGLATAARFSVILVRGRAGAPSTIWGLALVPPMVSATCGAALIPHLSLPGWRSVMLVATCLCFVLALSLAGVVFSIAYHHHWRVEPLPVAASASAWIPLGVIGQSTAAAQVIAHQSERVVPEALSQLWLSMATGYGYLALAVGVPLTAWAIAKTVRGFRHRMPFTPGWWALTFPIGTLSLGSHLLGASTGSGLLMAVGVASWLALCGTWTLCSLSTALALRSARCR